MAHEQPRVRRCSGYWGARRRRRFLQGHDQSKRFNRIAGIEDVVPSAPPPLGQDDDHARAGGLTSLQGAQGDPRLALGTLGHRNDHAGLARHLEVITAKERQLDPGFREARQWLSGFHGRFAAAGLPYKQGRILSQSTGAYRVPWGAHFLARDGDCYKKRAPCQLLGELQQTTPLNICNTNSCTKRQLQSTISRWLRSHAIPLHREFKE